MHPLRSVVQAIGWCDTLEIERGDADELTSTGLEVPEGYENLAVRAVEAMRERQSVPPLRIDLAKSIPLEAGLGGGSSDAAAALVAVCDLVGADRSVARSVAPEVGADVTFFLRGGTATMSGYGERIEQMDPLSGFSVAVVVPEFGLSTPAVYSMWDQLGGPEGFAVPDRLLPPGLRNEFPVRNDLYRAAVAVEPALGDFVAETARLWDTAVMMTGSGSACFGFFGSLEEAEEAAASAHGTRAHKGVDLRPDGVRRIDEE
jgi:4-diphosphocytidyl-2-C-methyl-D-erythritol kinase